ncbi:hypothetical protein IFR05_006092 [Cadophora sp. M221]|nr:hypothetical protein IFR05_006092 [Cadophora sp. M221]
MSLENAIGRKDSLRSTKNRVDEYATSSAPAPDDARRGDVGIPSEVADASKEVVKWSKERRTGEFNTEHAPTELSDVKEQIIVDSPSDSENEKNVLLIYDIEDEDDGDNELESQAVSIEVPEKLLRWISQTINVERND